MPRTNKRDRLADILETARAVISQLDLDKALAVVLRRSLAVTRTRAGSIALYDRTSNRLRMHAHKGFSRNFVGNREWKVRRGGLTDRLLRTKKLTVITNTTHKTFFTNPLAVEEGIKSLVCVPLVHQREVIGILYVDDFAPRIFTKDSLQELEVLSSFAAIAIRHAQMHRDLQQKAITDSLTGLFNRRYFEEILSRELQRSERYGREFSLALVDVNDFKKFNDRFGHQAGDEALSALGGAIRRALRSTDLACRYGGDEMVVVLPETRLEKAYNLFVRRTRDEIEGGFSELTGGKYRLSVTIGIASYPVDGVTARDLVLAADRALLHAKKHKRTSAIGCAHPLQPGPTL